MYAVIKTGGKQLKVAVGDVLRVELLDVTPESEYTFEEVLMIGEGDQVNVGAPLVGGASVKAEVLGHGRGDKIKVVKHKRRKHHHKEMGHRQYYTEVRVTDITKAA